MPLNKLDNFIKNTEGRILYVSPSDLDSTDSISNQGNSLAQPFKTIQRALIESARFSYLKGNNNDLIERTTILLMPGEHTVDNRPGHALKNDGGIAKVVSPGGGESAASDTLGLTLDSNFDLTQEDNVLHKFNSVHGGVIVPRGTSIVGLDLRKTKIRPKYVPNPTDDAVPYSAIFRITGTCYFWQFSIFDADENGLVFTDHQSFAEVNRVKPLFSHHKLTVFEYADGVNNVTDYQLTDLDMYYGKLSNAYSIASGRDIDSKFPADPDGFAKQRPEWEIVGAFAADPINIAKIFSGDEGSKTPSSIVTVITTENHNLTAGTPIKINNVAVNEYNISTKVQNVDIDDPKRFTYLLPDFSKGLIAEPGLTSGGGKASVTIETDTVSGASPYIFNCSLRSVFGMNGMHADGSKADGFRSMVVAQFTGISLQKDDRAFAKYNPSSRQYLTLDATKVVGSTLAKKSSSTNSETVYHLDSGAVYRQGWETCHIKITNDAILQIVSVFAIGYNKHFEAQSGGDASITNSNSNFGQLSLVSKGFKKEAFTKDDRAFITNIIAPKSITSEEEDIDWISLDVGVTTNVSNNKRLYLFGFKDIDIAPPVLTQGYRVGSKFEDILYVDFSSVVDVIEGGAISGYGVSEAQILMTDKDDSGEIIQTGFSGTKEYPVISGPTANRFALNSHNLSTGEKVVVVSNTGDYPENIQTDIVYYVIDDGDDNHIRLAASKTDADNYSNLGRGDITVYGGSQLKILSRVTDKVAGDIGHPVQFDDTPTVKQWYISVSTDNDVYTAITQIGVNTDRGLDVNTEPSFIKRTADSRSLDDKIYKVRVVIPKELSGSKDPENGFIMQESSTTGVRTDSDFNLASITDDDYLYKRNTRFISTCSFTAGSPNSTVSVTSDLPHNLNVGDQIIVKNVTDSTNPVGSATSGYNGTHTVKAVTNDMQFTYETNKTLGSSLTNDLNTRTSDLPRFERNDLKSNLFVYRNEIIQRYIEGQQSGIYNVFVLGADVGITTEFTDYRYSQNVVNLYPQMDRDNINDNPGSAESFALRSPLGEVATNDLKKSITRKSIDNLITTFNNKFTIANESDLSVVAGIATITFTREHGLSGIATFAAIAGGSGHTNGTFYNVKLFNEVGLSSWNGATATVGISGGAVVSVDIESPGSGYQDADVLYVDTAVIGGSANATVTLRGDGLTGSIISTGAGVLDRGAAIQVTGIGTTSDGYYRVVSVPSKNQIAIAKTAGDPISISGQYVLPTGTVGITTRAGSGYNAITDIAKVTLPYAHGLSAGDKFTLKRIDGAEPPVEYTVTSRVGVNTFTVNKPRPKFEPGHPTDEGRRYYIIPHGLSANNNNLDKSDVDAAVRGIKLYANEVFTFEGFPDPTDNTKIQISSPTLGIGTEKRLPLGSYIQIDNEIMRISTNTLSGAGNNRLTVLRGALGTGIQTHDAGSFAYKVNPLSIEFRRPSILRASGHTFEYLGYGPGNYSTGLPQVQDRTLTENEEYLSQSQEKDAGAVVYTGMNSKGDFYIGNQKKSALTGEETTFDTPIPTVTGQDPSRLSVVFDEVIVKENLIVEGGDSKQILSQFDGPVTFNNQIFAKDKATFNKQVKITDETGSTSPTTGALVIEGGVGIGGTVNISQFASFNFPDSVDDDENARLKFGDDGDLQIYHRFETTGGVDFEDSFIRDTGNGNLNLDTNSPNSEIRLMNGGRIADGRMGIFKAGGPVELYYDNTIRFATSGIGVTVYGRLDVTDGDVQVSGMMTVEHLHVIKSPHTDQDVRIDAGGGIEIRKAQDHSREGSPNAGPFIDFRRSGEYEGDGVNDYDARIQMDVTGGGTGTSDGEIVFFTPDGAGPLPRNGGNENGAVTEAFRVQRGGATVTGDLNVTGDITAFFSASDQNLKDNITPIEDPLAKVLSISGNTFTWKEGNPNQGEDTGVVAQEIEALGLPGIVKDQESGHKSVQYHKLVPLLIEAIKELSIKVENLEQKLQDK